MTFAPPVDTLNRGHATLWGNLGDWGESTRYVEAARALALRVGEFGRLGPGQRVVDLGSGAGDQLRVWVEHFGVTQVTGVEADADLADRADARVREWGLDSRIRVVLGEATTTAWTDEPVDRVVALDSAYFFPSRTALLRRCRAGLHAGGRIVVTDLLLGKGVRARVAAAAAPIFGMPVRRLLTEARYRALLTECGFDDIRVDDRTEAVLGGFSRWTRRGGVLGLGSARPSTRLGLSMTGRAAGVVARSHALRYVVLSARRAAE